MDGGKKFQSAPTSKTLSVKTKKKEWTKTADHMKIVNVASLQNVRLFNSPSYASCIARKYLRYGKILENGTAGSVGKDQNTNRKFLPQLVL